MKYAFAGDRDVAVWVLSYLLEQGYNPAAILLSAPGQASHDGELLAQLGAAVDVPVLRGSEFRTPDGMELLRRLDLDLLVSIHFPYLVPPKILAIPRMGAVNLHPAYLPFNRGWHTPSWALLEGTPAGATLHFMTPEVDAGDIIHRKQLEPSPGDTANTLYARLKHLELEVFREAWPSLAAGGSPRIPQDCAEGTLHTRRDLLDPVIQRISLEDHVRAGDLLLRLRALTTNRLDEAAYYEIDGRRYRVQVTVSDEKAPLVAGANAD